MSPADKAELVGNLIMLALLTASCGITIITDGIRERARHARRARHRRPRVVRSREH